MHEIDAIIEAAERIIRECGVPDYFFNKDGEYHRIRKLGQKESHVECEFTPWEVSNS